MALQNTHTPHKRKPPSIGVLLGIVLCIGLSLLYIYSPLAALADGTPLEVGSLLTSTAPNSGDGSVETAKKSAANELSAKNNKADGTDATNAPEGAEGSEDAEGAQNTTNTTSEAANTKDANTPDEDKTTNTKSDTKDESSGEDGSADAAGAALAQAAPALTPAAADPVAKIGSTTYTTIEEAISAAEVMGGTQTIELLTDEVELTQTSVIVSGTIVIRKATTGYAGSAEVPTIKRGVIGNLFEVDGNATLRFEKVNLDGNKDTYASTTQENSLVILANKGTLQLGAGTTFTNNTSATAALVAKTGASISLEAGSTITQCINAGAGAGAVQVDGAGSVFNAEGALISDNTATSSTAGTGGALAALNSATVNLSQNTTLDHNTAGYAGGALYATSNAVVNITGATIQNNVVDGANTAGYGGGIYASTATIKLAGATTIYTNTARGVQDNLCLESATSKLVITGLITGNVGITSRDGKLMGSGTAFATTLAASASSMDGLQRLISDTDQSLVGGAGSTNQVVWAAAYVCKIVDAAGNATKDSLFANVSDAFSAIYAGTAPKQADGSYRIEVLEQAITSDDVLTVGKSDGSLNVSITLTTASINATDGYPYRGKPGSQATFTMDFYAGCDIYTGGSINFSNITIDGDSLAYSSWQSRTYTLISVYGGKLAFTNNSVIQNFRSSNKSTILMENDAEVTLDSTLVSNCVTTRSSKSGFFEASKATGKLNVNNCTFSKCATNAGSGGVFYLSGSGIMNVSNSTFVNNTAKLEGGAIYLSGGTINLTNTTMTSNSTSSGYGGAIGVVSSGTVRLSGNQTITGNTAGGKTGNIAVVSPTTILVAKEGISGVVGVCAGKYSTAAMTEGSQIAATETASASDTPGLSALKNDTNNDLSGIASTGNTVVWGSNQPACKIVDKSGTVHVYTTLSAAAQAANTTFANQAVTIQMLTDSWSMQQDFSDSATTVDPTTGKTVSRNYHGVTFTNPNGVILTTALTASQGNTDAYPYRGAKGTYAVLHRSMSASVTSGVAYYTSMLRVGTPASGTCTLTIYNLVVDGDSGVTGGNGAGIYVESGQKLLLGNGSAIRNSNALTLTGAAGQTGDGGAVYLAEGAELTTLGNASITNSSAAHNGGAVYAAANARVIMYGASSITSNSAGAQGGGIYMTPSALFAASDAPQVTSNKASESKVSIQDSNVYLVSGANGHVYAIGTLNGANIGVYPEVNYGMSTVFGHAATYANNTLTLISAKQRDGISCFTNDRTGLTGAAGSDSNLVWGSKHVPATLYTDAANSWTWLVALSSALLLAALSLHVLQRRILRRLKRTDSKS